MLCVGMISNLPSGQTSSPQTPISSADRPLRTTLRNPDAIAVVIGLSHYQNVDMPEVQFAVKDAQGIHDLLIQTFGYQDSRILMRTNDQLSLAHLRQLIRQELPSKVKAGKSDVFVYYSGHGIPSVKTQEPYLAPWDYDPSFPPSEDSAYLLKDFYADLASLPARSVTVVLDTCFSGGCDTGQGCTTLKGARGAFFEDKRPVAALPNGLVVTATGPGEIATEDKTHQHGLLTYYLLEALHGDAADEQGRVTAGRLEQYLEEKVPQAAEELRHRKQMPQVVAVDSNQVLAQLPVSAIKTGQAVVEQAYGSLRVTLIAGGDLYVDGIQQKTLQPGEVFFQKQIAAGQHQIEVRKQGQQLTAEQIVVMPNQTVEKVYSFLPEAPQVEKAYGLIRISSDAGGTLYIDDHRVVELAPFEKYTTGKTEAGPHQVRVEKPGYDGASQELLVRPNQTASYEFSLRRTPPTYPAIQAAPTSAQVPEALNPAHRFFVVASNLHVTATDSGQECSLTPGDVVMRLSDTPDENQNVTARVASSKKGDCATGKDVAVSVQALQEMDNQFRQHLDSGLSRLADNSGTNGLPKAPDRNLTPQAYFGTWKKINPGGYSTVIISGTSAHTKVHTWGSCLPQDCDEGEHEASWQGDALVSVFKHQSQSTTGELIPYEKTYRLTLDGSNGLRLFPHLHNLKTNEETDGVMMYYRRVAP
jgi:uncharacterized caspase-like protein